MQLKYYNSDNNRPDPVVQNELDALLESNPTALGVCETAGHRMKRRKGFKKFQSRRGRPRKDIGAYVNADARPGKARYKVMKKGWAKRKGRAGRHNPRAFFWVRVTDPIAGHGWLLFAQLPPNTRDTDAAREEMFDEMIKVSRKLLRQGGWLAILMDSNSMADRFANKLGGQRIGEMVDTVIMVGRKVKFRSWYRRAADGVRLLSDHGHALVAKVWFRRKKGK